MKIWIVLLLALPFWAQAYRPTSENACTPLNLSQDNLGKVRNQGNISWCYAFSASDMLAYTFDVKEKISAADIALNYNNSFLGRAVDIFANYGTPHETGFNKIALKRAMKSGYCPEEVFPSEKWIKVIDGREIEVPMKSAMDDIEKLHQERKTLTADTLPYYFKFKNVGPEEFFSLLQTKKIRKFYSKLRLRVCEKDRKDFETYWKVKMVFKNKRIFSRLSQQLEQGRIVGLDYDARILVNRDHQGLKLSNLHTSSIVGRRWNAKHKTCEYLIRNSYGESCSRYDSTYDCKEGNIWLGESQIYRSMISMVYMLSSPKL